MTTIHYSEFATLASCERQWAYRYALDSPEKGERRGLHLGTLLHLGLASWLNGEGTALPRTWTVEEYSTGSEPGELRTYELADFDPEITARANWLLTRYEKHYGSAPPPHWHTISTEQRLTAAMPWGDLVGTVDAIIEIDGQLWVMEHKSYGSKGRLDYVPVDPQIGVYDLLVEANYGQPAFGILYDGIYTFMWKETRRTLAAIREERGCSQAEAKLVQAAEPGVQRPPSESFERLELNLSDDHRRTTANYLGAAVEQRTMLLAHDDVLAATIPNVGRNCSWCGFRFECWSNLGGYEAPEIEVDDSEAEPV
jgi:hypothetical protein